MLKGLKRAADNATSSRSLDLKSEEASLDDASKGALKIMDDDLAGAEVHLKSGKSSYHRLAHGMVAFLRATLGFEQDVMKEAQELLYESEAITTADQRYAQRSSNVFRSKIYSPGAEYALCHAETQIMSAVVGVLNESVSESLKGFYKLRKAFQTLEGILGEEAKFYKQHQGLAGISAANASVDSLRSHRSTASAPGKMAGGWASADPSRPPSRQSLDKPRAGQAPLPPSTLARIDTGIVSGSGIAGDDEDQFFDAEDHIDDTVHDHYAGNIEIDGVIHRFEEVSLPSEEEQPQLERQESKLKHEDLIDHDPDSDIFSNPIDVFIHSGANLCFGMLNILISMIPPSFSRLLYIIGFHGDRERGIRMLWQASKFHNINGAMAGLIVLGYYNTFVGYSDIIPPVDPTAPEDEQLDGFPAQRCEELLEEMRRRHPKSHLWLLEESRSLAYNKQISKSMALLQSSTGSTFKQVAALETFELALNSMYSHNYTLCATSFIACLTLNNWSPGLYNYIAGSAHIELYRLSTDPAIKKQHAAKATSLLRAAPGHAGKKKFMARQLPFDVFVVRKVKKWEQRAHDLHVDFVDAVGVSPLEEMILFWNGYKRMSPSHLEESLERLAWSEQRQPAWVNETVDEKAVLAVCRAATLRNLDRLDEAERELKVHVLNVPHSELKGGLKDDWTAPVAHYEMAAICWRRSKEGRGDEKYVRECEGWVEKVAKWEAYELDARTGIKVSTAQNTLKMWKEKRASATGLR